MRIARRDRDALVAGMCLLLAPTILVGLAVGAPASAAAPTSAWQQANADGAKSNRVTGETRLTAANLASRGVTPSYSLAGLPPFGECGGFFGSPVPVTSTNRMFFYNGREIEARDIATGKLVWRSADLVGPDAISQVNQLSLSGGRIVASGIAGCESQSDPNGFVVALDASTGKQVWGHDTDQYIDDQTISGSTLVVVGEPDVLAPDLLAAYRVSDGAPLWKRTNCTPSNIFVVTSTVAAGSCGGVSLSTGKTLWKKPGWTFWRGDGPGVSDPAIYAKDTTGAIVALRPDGSVKWRPGTSYPTVLAAGATRVFVRCDGTAVCALARSTGVRQWKAPTDEVQSGRTALASDFAVIATDGSLVRASDGSFVGSLNSFDSGESWDAVAVADGRIIATQGRVVDVFVLAG